MTPKQIPLSRVSLGCDWHCVRRALAGVFLSHSYHNLPHLAQLIWGPWELWIGLCSFSCQIPVLSVPSQWGGWEWMAQEGRANRGKISGCVDVRNAIDFTRFFHWEDSELTSFCSQFGLWRHCLGHELSKNVRLWLYLNTLGEAELGLPGWDEGRCGWMWVAACLSAPSTFPQRHLMTRSPSTHQILQVLTGKGSSFNKDSQAEVQAGRWWSIKVLGKSVKSRITPWLVTAHLCS